MYQAEIIDINNLIFRTAKSMLQNGYESMKIGQDSETYIEAIIETLEDSKK